MNKKQQWYVVIHYFEQTMRVINSIQLWNQKDNSYKYIVTIVCILKIGYTWHWSIKLIQLIQTIQIT